MTTGDSAGGDRPASLLVPLETAAFLAGMWPEELAGEIPGVGPGDGIASADVLRVGARFGRRSAEAIAEALVDRVLRTDPEAIGLLWDDLQPVLEAEGPLVLKMPGIVMRVKLNHPPATLARMRAGLGDRA